MHDLCIFLICFCSKIIFDQKIFSICWDKLDNPGSIVYLSCFLFDVWQDLLMQFCHISLIWPLHRLDCIFKKCQVYDLWHYLWCHFAIFHLFYNYITIFNKLIWFLWNVCHGWNCLTRSEENFSKIFFRYHVLFLTYDVFCDVILLYWTPDPWSERVL